MGIRVFLVKLSTFLYVWIFSFKMLGGGVYTTFGWNSAYKQTSREHGGKRAKKFSWLLKLVSGATEIYRLKLTL